MLEQHASNIMLTQLHNYCKNVHAISNNCHTISIKRTFHVMAYLFFSSYRSTILWCTVGHNFRGHII